MALINEEIMRIRATVALMALISAISAMPMALMAGVVLIVGLCEVELKRVLPRGGRGGSVPRAYCR